MRLGREEIRADLSGSLDRLGLDRIGLYYVHRDDPARPVGEIMDTLAEAVRDGLVGRLGCSNWEAPRIRAAQQHAERSGLPRFVIDQMRWSLARANRESQRIPGLVEMNEPLRDYHLETQMAAAAYSSQAQGFFSGAYGRHVDHPEARSAEKVMAYYGSAENFDRLDRVLAMAERIGRPPTHVALGYLLSQPLPVYPIIGPSTVAHLNESIAAHDVVFGAEELLWLETGQRA
jgi:aryl-alcohol dehydrogenase-like predicted oxidoreductase